MTAMHGTLREQWARMQVLALERRTAWFADTDPSTVSLLSALEGSMEEGMTLGLMLAIHEPAMAERLLGYVLATNDAPYTEAQLEWVATGENR